MDLRRLSRRPAPALVLSVLALALPAAEPAVGDLVPRPTDYGHLWWAEWFPGVVSGAPWWRVLQTGRYALVLDVRQLQIAHLGPITAPSDYEGATHDDRVAWAGLPPADLVLRFTVEGVTYRATAGGPWTQRTGPRVIATGRWLQHADVTNLVFTGEDGRTLAAEGRFETIGWPDHLGFRLVVCPPRDRPGGRRPWTSA